jgi:protein ImuB
MSAIPSKNRTKKSPAGRLWLAIRLPDLPWQALSLANAIHDAENQPLTVSDKYKNSKPVIIWANAPAIASGVVLGMDATTAQLLSGCINHSRNRELEKQCLANLCAGLYQFTPYIEEYVSERLPHAGLLLEISSCLMLFGGIKKLTDNIAAYFTQQKLTFALGLAHSSKGAWLLTFDERAVAEDEQQALPEYFNQRLYQLPIQLLHDYPKQVEALEKTGFYSLGDIARQIEAQSISSIKKRFGQEFAQALCAIFGIEQNFQQRNLFEKPPEIYQPVEYFSERLQLEYPLNRVEQLEVPMESMLKKLVAYLRQRQLQTQHIEWVLADIYRHRDSVHVYADSAQSHWQLLFDLTLIQLENRDLPFEVDTLELHCRETMPLHNTAQLLDFDGKRKQADQEFVLTAAKLKARLGNAAVYKLSYRDSYLPEVSNQTIAIHETCQQTLPDYHRAAMRPHWLLPVPEMVQIRKQGLYWHGYLKLLIGPERLQGHWWKVPTVRDYFLAQRNDSARLWVFFDDRNKNWYVQGVFA